MLELCNVHTTCFFFIKNLNLGLRLRFLIFLESLRPTVLKLFLIFKKVFSIINAKNSIVDIVLTL